jgi:hypothetical protein
MEHNGFEEYSKAWKKSGLAGFSKKQYSENEINAFKMKKSQDFSQGLVNSITFDFVHKSILMAAMLLLTWFYRDNLLLVIAFVALTGFSIFLLIRENGIKNQFLKIDHYTNELSKSIREKLSFYEAHFPSLKVMMAFTNALLVWVGSLFYFYLKYRYYRIDDIVDLLVNLVMVGLSFAISYYALSYQYRFNVIEMEENIADLEDEHAVSIHIHRQKRRKRQLIVGLAILIAAGLILFLYLLMNYMKQPA